MMRRLALVLLIACGGSSHRAAPPPQRPPQQDQKPVAPQTVTHEEPAHESAQAPVRSDSADESDDIFESRDSRRAKSEQLEQLEQLAIDLEQAYQDLHAGAPDAVTKLRDLRARAEQQTGEEAWLGIPGDLIASVPGSKLRVVTDPGVTVVDKTNEPILWFDTFIEHRPCPPCGSDARSVVVFALSLHMVAATAIDVGKGAVLLDLASVRVIGRVPAVLSSVVISPDKRMAFVEESEDDNSPPQCHIDVTVVTAAGSVKKVATFVAPDPSYCSGTAIAWQHGKLLVTPAWGDNENPIEDTIVDTATGGVTFKRVRFPVLRPNKHLSKPLCGKSRKPFDQVGCHVGRFVFPSVACAGAKVETDSEPPWYCEPGVPPP